MKMYVGNMSYDTNESDVKELFSKHGEVVSVNIITFQDTGRSKGFGFVEMENKDDSESAITALNEYELHGRKIVVNVANDKPARRDGGNFGRSRNNNSFQRSSRY